MIKTGLKKRLPKEWLQITTAALPSWEEKGIIRNPSCLTLEEDMLG